MTLAAPDQDQNIEVWELPTWWRLHWQEGPESRNERDMTRRFVYHAALTDDFWAVDNDGYTILIPRRHSYHYFRRDPSDPYEWLLWVKNIGIEKISPNPPPWCTADATGTMQVTVETGSTTPEWDLYGWQGVRRVTVQMPDVMRNEDGTPELRPDPGTGINQPTSCTVFCRQWQITSRMLAGDFDPSLNMENFYIPEPWLGEDPNTVLCTHFGWENRREEPDVFYTEAHYTFNPRGWLIEWLGWNKETKKYDIPKILYEAMTGDQLARARADALKVPTP